MKSYNRCKYLTINIRILLFIITIIVIFSGCSNSKLIAKKKQFEKMSDKALLSHYHQIEDRLDDIDRDIERTRVKEDYSYDPDRDRIPLPHLHIGDTWYRLQQEKKLVLKELYKRDITP